MVYISINKIYIFYKYISKNMIEKDKNAYMLLSGYIEKHKETCDEVDCPLKIKK